MISWFRFSVQLLICELAFLIPRPRKDHFAPRAAGALAAYFAGGFAVWCLLRLIPGSLSWVHIVFYLSITSVCIGASMLAFAARPIELVFIGTCGYATEHIIFALTRVLVYLTGIDEQAMPAALDFLLFRCANYLLGAALMYLLVVRRNREKEVFRDRDIRVMILAVAVMVSAVVLSVFYTNTTGAETADPMLRQLICPLYSSLCCLLVILMEYYVFRENRLTMEKETMEQMLQMAEAQRLASSQSIDIINMRCHDLKHQLKALMRLEDTPEKREYIESIRSAVNIYNATYHTGSDALDYVLQEKALLAEEHGIEFTCMADGSILGFMKKVDIYALMGNALDNALEHTVQEAEGERFITLNIHRAGGMALLRLENTCTTPVSFVDGLPQTTKANRDEHGFGVRSIRYVADKYDGDVLMTAGDGRYCLSLALPIPEAA